MAILSNSGTASGYTNIGHDLVISLTGTDDVVITIFNVIRFEWRQNVVDIQHMRLDGSTLVADLPRSWEGTIDFHRHDGTLEREFKLIQDRWLAGGDYKLGTLTCRVSGTAPSTFVFGDVSIRFEDGGTWRGDDVTTQRIGFRAARLTAA